MMQVGCPSTTKAEKITYPSENPQQEASDVTGNVHDRSPEEFEEPTENPGDEFGPHSEVTQSCRIESTEPVAGNPDFRVVMNSYFSLTDDKTEWKGTTINFDA